MFNISLFLYLVQTYFFFCFSTGIFDINFRLLSNRLNIIEKVRLLDRVTHKRYGDDFHKEILLRNHRPIWPATCVPTCIHIHVMVDHIHVKTNHLQTHRPMSHLDTILLSVIVNLLLQLPQSFQDHVFGLPVR